MKAGRTLMILAAALFALTGCGYLLVPGVMLGVVGIDSSAVTDFLIRTEGVALLAGAGLFWTLRRADPARMRTGLFILAAYCVLGSVLDLWAFSQAIVGPASVPSAIARFVLAGGAMLVTRADV